MPCNYPHRLQRGPEADYQHLDVPCGRCMGCRIMNAQAWALRCAHEAQLHEDNCYITLTYNDKHLPPGATLNHRDWQLFAKKLRNERGPFRYFMCGEYGTKDKRPHYHACLFGIDFHDREPFTKEGEHQLYTSAELERIWGRGFTTIGNVSFQSAGYIARYITKNKSGPKAEGLYQRVSLDTGEIINVEPEYIRMSRNPGLGAAWLDRYQAEVLTHDAVHMNNRNYKVPKYYDKKIKEKDPERALQIQRKRIARALETDPKEHTKQRREAKERVLEARVRLRARA